MLLNCSLVMVIFLAFTGNALGNGCNLAEVKADIAFLLDSSSSINDSDFQSILQFVKNFTYSLTIGPDFVRAAVFKYAYMVSMEFDLNAYNTSQDIDQAIDNIHRTYGGTSTHSGLNQVYKYSGLVIGNTRPNVTHFLLLITGGYSNNKNATQNEARHLREEGVEIAAIGISSYVDKNELLNVASSKDHFYYINNFSMLQHLTSNIFGLLCGDEMEGYKTVQAGRNSISPIMIVLVIAIITGCGIALVVGSICCMRFFCLSKRSSDDTKKRKRLKRRQCSVVDVNS